MKYVTNILGATAVFCAVGCSSVETTPIDLSFLAPAASVIDSVHKVCISQDFNSTLIGRIIYADGSPYKRGAIKVQGSDWENIGVTDDTGTFNIDVKGDDRFFLSASSPFGDFAFYSLATPLLVPDFTVSTGYLCEYNEEVFVCIENGELL